MGSMDSYIAEQCHNYKYLCEKHGVDAVGGDEQYDHHEWLKLKDNDVIIYSFKLYYMIQKHKRQESKCKELQRKLYEEEEVRYKLWNEILKELSKHRQCVS